MPPDAEFVYDARDVRVRLGHAEVLRGLSFRVRAGEYVGLLGPNGAGKSTLLRTLAGVQPLAGGTLLLAGRPLPAWPARERARRVALVRQQTTLSFDFTAEEVVALGRAPHLGWLAPLAPSDRARVAAALAVLDLAPLAARPVPQLSGGEQQRVLLAQALAQDAPTLLLDEPTAHLDVRHQLDLLARVARLAAEGRTVIAAFHDLPLAARFASRLLVLRDGRIVADGPPAEVLTPGLLRDAFGVRAEVYPGPDGPAVRYLGPA